MDVLGLPFSEEDLIFIGAISIMGATIILIAVAFPLWFVMHRLLAHLDDVLLREPFFPKWDQPNWQVWPVSYLKTFNYVCLIAVPDIAMRKRFKGLEGMPEVGKVTRLLAKSHFVAMCLTGMMGCIQLLYFGFFAWIYPHLSN